MQLPCPIAGRAARSCAVTRLVPLPRRQVTHSRMCLGDAGCFVLLQCKHAHAHKAQTNATAPSAAGWQEYGGHCWASSSVLKPHTVSIHSPIHESTRQVLPRPNARSAAAPRLLKFMHDLSVAGTPPLTRFSSMCCRCCWPFRWWWCCCWCCFSGSRSIPETPGKSWSSSSVGLSERFSLTPTRLSRSPLRRRLSGR